MIPKIIHQIWIGPKKPFFEFAMSTMREINNSFVIKVWTDSNISEFLDDKTSILYNNPDVPKSYVANILRLKILSKYGGLGLDADYVALQDYSPIYNMFKDADLVVAERSTTYPGHPLPKFQSGFVCSSKGYIFSELIDSYSGLHLIGPTYSKFVENIEDKYILHESLSMHGEYLDHRYQLTHQSKDMSKL